MLERLGSGQWASFAQLVADCKVPVEIVGRFLALLELYRSRAVAFDQSEPLGVLQVSWTGERPTSAGGDAERSGEDEQRAAMQSEAMRTSETND
jgi:segregation and condensation protein A